MLEFLVPNRRTLLQPTWAAHPQITRPRVSAQREYIDVTVPLPGLCTRDVDVACDGTAVTVRAHGREATIVRLPCRASAGKPGWILRQGLLSVRIARADDLEARRRTVGARVREAWSALAGRLSRALRGRRLLLQEP